MKELLKSREFIHIEHKCMIHFLSEKQFEESQAPQAPQAPQNPQRRKRSSHRSRHVSHTRFKAEL